MVYPFEAAVELGAAHAKQAVRCAEEYVRRGGPDNQNPVFVARLH
jgi:hypothetical protein